MITVGASAHNILYLITGTLLETIFLLRMIGAIGMILQHLLEHRHQVAHINLMSGIFLRDLHLQHLVGPAKTAHQRMNRLTDLEIHRPVFNLKDDIVMIISVHRLEVIIAGTGAIRLVVSPVLRAVIDKAAPDDNAAVGLYNIRQHIGAVRLGSSIGKGSGTSLGIRLHKETAKIRNPTEDLLHLILPPRNNLCV